MGSHTRDIFSEWHVAWGVWIGGGGGGSGEDDDQDGGASIKCVYTSRVEETRIMRRYVYNMFFGF